MRKVKTFDADGNFTGYVFPVPEDIRLKGVPAPAFEDGAEVTVNFITGAGKSRECSVLTIGKVFNSRWDYQRDKFLYTLMSCPNIQDNIYVAWEYELSATTDADHKELAVTMKADAGKVGTE